MLRLFFAGQAPWGLTSLCHHVSPCSRVVPPSPYQRPNRLMPPNPSPSSLQTARGARRERLPASLLCPLTRFPLTTPRGQSPGSKPGGGIMNQPGYLLRTIGLIQRPAAGQSGSRLATVAAIQPHPGGARSRYSPRAASRGGEVACNSWRRRGPRWTAERGEVASVFSCALQFPGWVFDPAACSPPRSRTLSFHTCSACQSPPCPRCRGSGNARGGGARTGCCGGRGPGRPVALR